LSIDEILDAVPKYREFMTVEELDASSKELADEFSEVSLKRIGESREGRPILCLKIGKGERNALVFAFPHPNEPIGSMTVEFLSRYLAENPDFVREIGFTWYLVKAIDPDGVVLNEGWFKGEFDPVKYAKNFYRPASCEQMEWTFPVEYKRLSFSDPPPETRALMSIIEEVKPDFMYSLHNAGFCGVYFYLTHEIREVFPDLGELVKSEGLPLHQGEPESPYINVFSPGFFEMIGVQDRYDFFEDNDVENPQELINWGTSSADYLKTLTDERGFTLVCEMPYFYDPALEDSSLTDEDRRSLVLDKIEFGMEVYRYTKERFDHIRRYCDSSSKIFTSVADGIDNYEKRMAPQIQHAKTNPMYEGKATVAQAFDTKTATRYYAFLIPAMVARLCDEAAALNPSMKNELMAVKRELDEYVELGVRNILDGTDFTVVPIQKLVRVQVGSALHCMKHLSG